MKPEAPSGNPYTAGIAGCVARLDHDAIPGRVHDRAQLLLPDALAERVTVRRDPQTTAAPLAT